MSDMGLNYFEDRCGVAHEESLCRKPLVISKNGRYELRRYELHMVESGKVVSASYSIGHDQIPSQEALLAWILHLTEKLWVTQKLIHDLIECWECETGVSINRSLS